LISRPGPLAETCSSHKHPQRSSGRAHECKARTNATIMPCPASHMVRHSVPPAHMSDKPVRPLNLTPPLLLQLWADPALGGQLG